MKLLLSLVTLLGMFYSSIGQDWTSKQSELYYWTTEGKVFIEPDFGSLVVYYKDNPGQEVESKFKNNMAKARINGSDKMKTTLMSSKGMMSIQASSAFGEMSSKTKRQAFMEDYQMKEDDAYDVQPAFWVGDKQAWFSKRVIVRFKDGINYESLDEVFSEYDARYIKNITDANTLLVSMEQIDKQLEFIHKLHDMNVLDWGEPDFKVELVKYIDPGYQNQWHLNNTGGTIDGKSLSNDVDVDAPEAWAITTGSTSVTVAVIDDGVEAHEDMATLLTGYTPADGGNGTPYASTDGHGQACAGLIGAQHNEIGVRGLAPGVNIFSVNIFHPSTTNADVADAINWAVSNGADVLSNSWGFGSCTYNVSSITAAFQNAATNGRGGLGCIILIASGNDFFDCVSYPADLTTVTAVGGISGDGERSMFSNYGPTLDIVAPSDDDWVQQGGQWYSTGTHGLRTIDRMGANGWASGSSNYYDFFGGTSGATPQVAAVAALVLSVNGSLTKSEVENILYSTADDYGAAGFDNQYGNGMVNAHQAVLSAGGVVDTEAPSTPTGLSISSITSSSFDASWSASTDNIGVNGYNVFLNGSLQGTTANTSYSVNGLNPDTNYSFAVEAFDAAGNTSAQASVNTTTGIATLTCATTVSNYPYSEGFEANDGWTQVSGDDGNWVRDANGTPSSNTGPGSAVEGSFYLFLEASTNGSTGQIGNNATAILESPCFDLGGESVANFSFQNHMYGSNVGSIEVLASTDDQSWVSLWSLSGNQGNQWNNEDISLASYIGSTVKLRIVGTTGNGWSSDIAIDDISLSTSGSADTEAPSIPSALVSSGVTTSSFDVSWDTSSDNVGVTGYNVYLDDNLDGSTTSTNYAFVGLNASTAYDVSIEALDAAGNTSAQANLQVTTLSGSSGSDVLVTGFFESGWDGWSDGGSDVARYTNGTRSYEGNASIRIRDNSGAGSTMSYTGVDISAYDQLEIEFYFYAFSMENGEDFFVNFFNGSSWSTVASYAQGTSFTNNGFFVATVTLDASSYNFSSNAGFAFQNDASGNNDHIYIDAVTITGNYGASGSSPSISLTSASQSSEPKLLRELNESIDLDLDQISIYPNPVVSTLKFDNLPEGSEVRLISLSGQVLFQQLDPTELNMSDQNSGVYILHIQTEDQSRIERIIKQ